MYKRQALKRPMEPGGRLRLTAAEIDRLMEDVYKRQEYRRIGVNYNQIVKAVHSGELTEKKALALLYKLEQLTVERCV